MSAYTISEPEQVQPPTPDELSIVESTYRDAVRHMVEEDYAAAERVLKRSLALVPGHARSLASLSICIAEGHGRFMTAEKLARKAAHLGGDLPDGYLALCRINRLGARPDRARTYLERARRIAPDDPRIGLEVSVLNAQRGPVFADLPSNHVVNKRLGQLREVLLMRLKVTRKGISVEAAA